MSANKNQSMAIIPARLKSSRFPEKVLARAIDKSLLKHTFENTKKTNIFNKIFIATDHQKVKDHADDFCDHVYLTSENCKNGTERIIDLLKSMESISDDQIIFNIQADHPMVSEETLRKIEKILTEDPLAMVATAACPIMNEIKYRSPHIVKCILDRYNNAIYFSRSPIPFLKKEKIGYPCYQHIGIYAFRKKFLDLYEKFDTTPLCESEDLEQLKILEYGYKIKVAIVDENPIGIDTPEDMQDFLKVLQMQESKSAN